MMLEARRRWTLTKLGHVVNAGRMEGWLPGDLIEGVASMASVELQREISVMATMATRLALSQQELDTLWILACVELFPDVAAASQVLVSHGMHELNAQVIEQLTALDDAGLANLARFGLIETSMDPRLPRFRRPVRASDRVLELARGHMVLDRALHGIGTLEVARDSRAARIAAEQLVVAVGAEGCGRLAALRRLATGRTLLVVQCRRMTGAHDKVLRVVTREALLHDALVVLCDMDAVEFAIVDRELGEMRDAVLATARESAAWSTRRTVVVVPISFPEPAHRAVLWEDALPDVDARVIAECARRYRVSATTIETAAKSARASAIDGRVTIDDVHAALRCQLERKLTGIASRIETTQTWDDLVLPVEQQDVLLELISRVRHRDLVMDTWGFADKIGRGLGVSVLLSGPAGTGKTMIAGLLAKELGLDLYQVDLSKLVSKYIGETEKQLAALFDAAESGHAILLFDEADSLFGKRTEVKSSNDRYANLEVNYLLQRMEQFTGISILTTNYEKAIDPAFQRRLAFHLRVPMPDEEQRALMWKTLLPMKAAQAANINVGKLASGFVMSGGYIKNAVVRAAFLAAGEGAPICASHLERAARLEYEALGKLAS
jgi:hypothetical protein